MIHYMSPKIMTADRPLQEMGYRSMELLLDNIEGKNTEDISVILPCELIEGASVSIRKNGAKSEESRKS